MDARLDAAADAGAIEIRVTIDDLDRGRNGRARVLQLGQRLDVIVAFGVSSREQDHREPSSSGNSAGLEPAVALLRYASRMARWNAGSVLACTITSLIACTTPDDGDAETTSAQSTLPGTTIPGTTDPTPVSDSASSGPTEACVEEMYTEQHCFDPGGATTTLGPDEWGSTSGDESTGGDAAMCDGLDPPIPDNCAKVIVNTGPAYVAAGMCCYDVDYMRGCCG